MTCCIISRNEVYVYHMTVKKGPSLNYHLRVFVVRCFSLCLACNTRRTCVL